MTAEQLNTIGEWIVSGIFLTLTVGLIIIAVYIAAAMRMHGDD